ncbi:hypothetical protein GGR51DRAFT_562413 [Nemania sp. FL0031]|nr:hypothetical protein GGR51DRAFT_562413 [Nemania sp. FL0031]
MERGSSSSIVSRHLNPILQATADPLKVIFDNNHPEIYHEEIFYKMRCRKEPQVYLVAMSPKHLQLTIFTEHVLNALFTAEGKHIINDLVFDGARVKFARYAPRMKYGVLCLKLDALNQGYEAEDYDIVVVALILPATGDLAATIRNVRYLLIPRGKPILFEIMDSSSLRNGLAFGTLPGRWLSAGPER